MDLFGFLSPIEPSIEMESIKRGPAKTLQHYAAFLRDSMAIKIEIRDKNRKIDTDMATSDNINRKNKVGLSSDSDELSRSGSAKYNTALVSCRYHCYDDASRFLCFDKK